VPGESTSLWRAREILGGNARHLLLIYLLAQPDGSLVRDVQAWTRYTYRNLAETIKQWEAAGALQTNHGFCRLRLTGVWRELLRVGDGRIRVVDWFVAFDAVVRLLRTLQQGGRRGLSPESTVIESSRREAEEVIRNASGTDGRVTGAIEHLLGA
jgi:hypothetical protein